MTSSQAPPTAEPETPSVAVLLAAALMIAPLVALEAFTWMCYWAWFARYAFPDLPPLGYKGALAVTFFVDIVFFPVLYRLGRDEPLGQTEGVTVLAARIAKYGSTLVALLVFGTFARLVLELMS